MNKSVGVFASAVSGALVFLMVLIVLGTINHFILVPHEKGALCATGCSQINGTYFDWGTDGGLSGTVVWCKCYKDAKVIEIWRG